MNPRRGATRQPSAKAARRGSKPSRARRAGLSMVETAALISLSGVLAAAFTPTFVKHLRFSKVAEASEQLETLFRSSAAYYASDQRVGGHLLRGCLPDSAGPTPGEPSAKPVSVDFSAADVVGHATWQALGQSEPRMLRYSYQVEVAEPGCGPRSTPAYPAVTLRAFGDLDGDGNRSRLERSAAISSDQTTLTPIIPLRILDRVE